MKPFHLLSALVLVTLLLSAPLARAAFVPATLSYQGSLYNTDGSPFNGVKNITFKLYTDSTAGTAFWTEVQTSVNITNGRFATVLGNSTQPLNPGSFTTDIYLGIQVDGEATEMTPRQKMTSVAFAFSAGGSVPVGGIIMWSGSVATIPAGWALCDGTNSTPNLSGKFVIGTNATFAQGTTGGNLNHFHKGFSEGGDLRASIGSGASGELIELRSFPALSPNTNNQAYGAGYQTLRITNSNYSNLGSAAVPYYFTPVYGYTSSGFQGVPVSSGANGSATAGSLPPYYSLAYIMRVQ